MNFSKSKYTAFVQCPKTTWLYKNKPEEAFFDAATLARMDTGNEFGDLAMGLFGEYIEVTAHKDGKLDLDAMIKATDECIKRGTEVICEASFSYNGLYCAVDILKRTRLGYAIFEVKSSTHPENAQYAIDVAYQRYVLERCGVRVTGTFVVTPNKNYILGERLEIDKLCMITDISAGVNEHYPLVEKNLAAAERIKEQEAEPDIDISPRCFCPYGCAFWKYCSRHLPTPSVFDLYSMKADDKFELYRNGIVSFEDVMQSGVAKKNKIRSLQVEHGVFQRGTSYDKTKIREFLDGLWYPLYFLDFETVSPLVPIYKGTGANERIPFQYSLHYIEKEGGELKHKEFLGEPEQNPCKPIAKSLVENIPPDACVLAYNMAFEKGVLKELAGRFPELSERLCAVAENVRDLIVPFRSGACYNRQMGGSFSIKSVLPALFPSDRALDYTGLDGVHNGTEAMNIFPRMKDMTAEQRERTRAALLEYCGLDTLAMVRIYEHLVENSK